LSKECSLYTQQTGTGRSRVGVTVRNGPTVDLFSEVFSHKGKNQEEKETTDHKDGKNTISIEIWVAKSMQKSK
jgi:hypothetical protein